MTDSPVTSNGNKFNPLDVSNLTPEQTQDYRQELIRSIWNPGTDWTQLETDAAESTLNYRKQLGLADAHLASFGLGDASSGTESRPQDATS